VVVVVVVVVVVPQTPEEAWQERVASTLRARKSKMCTTETPQAARLRTAGSESRSSWISRHPEHWTEWPSAERE
jgi:hypothetical protein